jgi:hypothetical protein
MLARPESGVTMRIGLLAFLVAVLASCGSDPSLDGPAGASFQVPADFVFVRDSVGLFPPGQVRQAEEDLRFQAERSGVFGVVITAERADDPPTIFRPIVAEIQELGGEALIAICTPDACDLTGATAYSESLADRIEQVAPDPEPAPGQGIPANPRNELRRWRELVGTIATLVAEGDSR